MAFNIVNLLAGRLYKLISNRFITKFHVVCMSFDRILLQRISVVWVQKVLDVAIYSVIETLANAHWLIAVVTWSTLLSIPVKRPLISALFAGTLEVSKWVSNKHNYKHKKFKYHIFNTKPMNKIEVLLNLFSLSYSLYSINTFLVSP